MRTNKTRPGFLPTDRGMLINELATEIAKTTGFRIVVTWMLAWKYRESRCDIQDLTNIATDLIPA